MGEFESRIILLSGEGVIDMWKNNKNPELNNVVEGFEKNFFGIVIPDLEKLDSYLLIYVGNYDKLEGLVFESGRKVEDRDTLTLRFSKLIEETFPELNQLVVFNTFQSKVTQLYETFGIVCVPDYIAKLENASLLMPSNKSSIDHVLRFDILTLYRTYFEREKLVQNINGENKIYLMYDRKYDKVKIGKTRKKLETRKKGVAEATKRANDPMIELLSAWKAPDHLESMLHSKYALKRIRGEWFDLRAFDLDEINTLTQEYEMITIK